MGVRVDTPYILLERMIEMREKINWRQHVVLGLLLLSAILSLGGCGDGSASSASGSADSVTQVKEVTRKDGKDEKEIMSTVPPSERTKSSRTAASPGCCISLNGIGRSC